MAVGYTVGPCINHNAHQATTDVHFLPKKPALRLIFLVSGSQPLLKGLTFAETCAKSPETPLNNPKGTRTASNLGLCKEHRIPAKTRAVID